jgi:predicted negative regulator of RcsB-dependent stress response
MAIDDPLDEHEQSERVLEWLRRNGAGLIGGVVLGLAAIGGWKWWQQQQQQEQFARAAQYQAALDAIAAGDEQAAAKVAGLGEDIYAKLAALELAAAQVEAGNSDAAIETLRGIGDADPAIAAIAEQRLARLLIGADKAAEALELLDGADTAAAFEIRGDAQFALGQAEQARESYNDALTRLDVGSPQRRVVELKLAQVGAPVPQTEAQS